MLATHLIAASLAAAPATAPLERQSVPPALVAPPSAPEASPAIDIPPPANPAESSSVAAPAAAQQAPQQAPPPGPAATAPAEDFDLDLDHAGLEHDPLEGFNRISFAFSQALDKVLIRPAAMVYRHFPQPARDGVHNAISNLGEPVVFLNDLLQLRPDRAVRTLGRFLLNSTLGLGGLFDVAKRKPFHLPHHANSLGDTLGYYGLGPGPYIYVPILGPATLRDLTGSAEQLLSPLVIGAPFDNTDYQIATLVAGGLDQRERADEDLKAMLRDAVDPYATLRANFLQNRAGEIAALKSHELDAQTAPASTDPLAEPLVDPATPATKPAPSGQ
jgi:phospholipid-binding lipoprotein MlaA